MANTDIERVCVIGAGVMGAAIAAQVANAGVRVLLLDTLPKDESADRNSVAMAAIARLLKTDPAPFMSQASAKLVEAGNIEDDLGRVAECDWVIEAIVERLDAKQALYRRLDAVRRPGTAISSNTSTIPLAQLIEGLPGSLQRDFMITHFFNPPRYMRLLEVVASPTTDATLVDRIAQFSDHRLGKTVVRAKDTPGFIANRIGTFWLQHGVNAAIDLGLTVEEADAVMGRPFGIPKTGVFGLLDLVGLDLMPHINASMKASLPADDAFLASLRESPLLNRMIAEGYTGRKGLGGFYRINRTAGESEGVYRPRHRRLWQLVQGERAGRVVAKPEGADRVHRQAGPLCLGGDGGDARLCREPGAGDRRRHRIGGCGHAPRLQLEAGPVRAARRARTEGGRRTAGAGRPAGACAAAAGR